MALEPEQISLNGVGWQRKTPVLYGYFHFHGVQHTPFNFYRQTDPVPSPSLPCTGALAWPEGSTDNWITKVQKSQNCVSSLFTRQK